MVGSGVPRAALRSFAFKEDGSSPSETALRGRSRAAARGNASPDGRTPRRKGRRLAGGGDGLYCETTGCLSRRRLVVRADGSSRESTPRLASRRLGGGADGSPQKKMAPPGGKRP